LGTAVEEDVLFRLCDTIVDRDVAGALVSVEELAERGLDLAQLTRDLLEHLRHLLLVQHLGHVPDSLPLTEESRERLREQANQLPEPTVVRLIDLLAVVLEDERQGGDPRLPLELALVKVTRPQSDLARESLVHRVEVLESRVHAGSPAAESWGPSPVPAPAAGPAPAVEDREPSPASAPDVSLEQMQEAWTRSVLPAVKERSIPAATLLAEASPSGLEGDTLTLSFRPGAEFHRTQAEEPGYAQLLRDALYDVTGRRLAVVTAVADSIPDEGTEEALDERGFIALLETDLDATEVEETP
jgi:DNA polymerase III gamma/tau subunit